MTEYKKGTIVYYKAVGYYITTKVRGTENAYQLFIKHYSSIADPFLDADIGPYGINNHIVKSIQQFEEETGSKLPKWALDYIQPVKRNLVTVRLP